MISFKHQVIQEYEQRHIFYPQEAEDGREGRRKSGRDGWKSEIENDN